MWTRAELKDRAKSVLKISYWKAFLVSLIIAIVAGGDSSYNMRANFKRPFRRNEFNEFTNFNGDFNFNTDFNSDVMVVIAIILIVVLIIFLIVAAFRIFLGAPLEVGGRRYFVESAQNRADMNNIGFAFNRGRYKGIVLTMLWKDFLNFLWFLLLIIPGIVKAYAYSMVPYILADNPNIGYKRAVELSVQMTDGEKFNIFVLGLSFLGWYLLGALAFGLGGLFVNPYKNATEAELYLVLKENAINKGLCTYNELTSNDMLI
ncbi:DUF975 family protein [Clostridium tunisiense]|uniref:DUF975 family protein n=1 Tax=Clostridium tunisiense TaxID=219748 RepID=UPI00030D0843|nr:DUF975 family protein [Clostridium tunisiense]